jgi:toxin-antitoxin system PIN domain toxin
MKLADSNVWLALALRGHSYHSAAQAWFNMQAKGEVLFCRATQQSFLRLLTTAAVLARYDEPPFTNADAWAFYQQLLLDNRISFRDEPAGLDVIWHGFASRPTASPTVDGCLPRSICAGR